MHAPLLSSRGASCFTGLTPAATRTRLRSTRRGVRTSAEPLERRVLLSAGDLDTAFGGGDGIVTTDFGGNETAYDVALLPGGKIVVAGTGGVVRYNADGTLDRTFGGDGRADITGDVTALAVQADGGVVGLASGGLVRFTAEGVRDMSFGGGDGVATAPAASGVTSLRDVGVQPGGRIVASPADFLGLVGFTAAGDLDTTFGRGGSNGDGVVAADVEVPFRASSESDEHFRSSGPLAVGPDGYVVVAGSAGPLYERGTLPWSGIAAARFAPDGTFDPTFSPSGRAVWVDQGDPYDDPSTLGAAIAPDGRIVVVGRHWDVDGTFVRDTVYRFLPDGGRDQTFGAGGEAGIGDLANSAAAVAVQADGKVLLAGTGDAGTPGQPRNGFGLVRLNRDGTPDPMFGPDGDGGVATAIGSGAAAGSAIAVQPDGKILVAGTAGGDVALVRYQGDGVIDGDDQAAEAYLVPRPLRPIESRSVDGPADVDLYRFDVAAGRRIGFDVDKSDGSALDAYLRVFGPTGTPLGSNDDAAAPGESAAGGDPYLEVTLPAAGTYYVGVSSKGNAAYNAITGAGDAGGASTGGYSLTLADRTPRAAGDYDFAFGFDGLAPRVSGGWEGEGGIALLPAGGYIAGSFLHNPNEDPATDPHNPGNDDLAVTRYTAVGLLQTSFGPYEQGRSAPSGINSVAVDEQADVVAALPDGRILAVGRRTGLDSLESSTITLARYDPSGALVGGGEFSIGTNDRLAAVAVLEGGKFLVAGTEAAGPEGQDFFVARFNADATLDTTFARGGGDGDGVATIDFAGRADELAGVAVLSDGSILAAGTAATSSGTDFSATRLNADGSLDTTFGGGDGIITTDFGGPGGDDTAAAIVALPGGKFALAGGATLTDRSEIALARYNADGTLDATFGSGGRTTTRLAGPAAAGAAFADGDRILVGGRQGFGLARYTAAGTLDATFGVSGFAATPVGAVSQILPLPGGDWLVNGANGRARHLAAAFPADGAAVIYEAEQASVTGGGVASDHAGFTGSGFVDFFHATGDAVEFTVDAPSAGAYELAFRYANDGSSTRTMDLYVNGAKMPSGVSFARTGSWEAWSVRPVTVSLVAGANEVRLQTSGQNGPNLDSLSVRRVAPQGPVTYQAEAATLSGAVAAADVGGYTGTGFADYRNRSGDFVEFALEVPAAGAYALAFRYANGSTADRPLELSVDGRVIDPRFEFAPTGAWRTWEITSLPVTLSAGPHVVRLTTAGSSGPNLDALTVSPTVTPPPPVEPVTLQAEAAALDGPVVASNVPGYTGTGFADYQHGSGDSVEFTYTAPRAGDYVLTFRYANGSSSDRPLELRVNGAVALRNLSFAPTGAWRTWGLASPTVALAAGVNRIRLTTTGSNGPNLDALTVQPSGPT